MSAKTAAAINIGKPRSDGWAPSPRDLATTPGGTLYATTPGGTRIVYDRERLLQLQHSPLSKSPLTLPNIPGITSPGDESKTSKPKKDVKPAKTDSDDVFQMDDKRKNETEAHELLTQYHAIQERIFTVRQDDERTDADLQQLIRNLVTELKRLEIKMSKNRKQGIQLLQLQLELPKIGLSAKYIARSLRSDEDGNLSPSDADSDESGEEEEKPDNITLMKAKPSDSLEGQTAQNRWQSLYKMFKEWKQQTNIAKAEYLISRDTSKEKEVKEDILKLRAAIQSLRERKDLTKDELDLLNKSTGRLKDLMEQQKQFH